MSANDSEEHDFINFHGIVRYAERAFSSANNRVARCLARMRRPKALQFLLNNTRSTNRWGVVPERIQYHGEPYIKWCMTRSSAQVLSLNVILAGWHDGQLIVIPGIDHGIWVEVFFENINVGGGFVVALELQSSLITKCEGNSPKSKALKAELSTLPYGMGLERQRSCMHHQPQPRVHPHPLHLNRGGVGSKERIIL